jgi:hypothetical protein
MEHGYFKTMGYGFDSRQWLRPLLRNGSAIVTKQPSQFSLRTFFKCDAARDDSFIVYGTSGRGFESRLMASAISSSAVEH